MCSGDTRRLARSASRLTAHRRRTGDGPVNGASLYIADCVYRHGGKGRGKGAAAAAAPAAPTPDPKDPLRQGRSYELFLTDEGKDSKLRYHLLGHSSDASHVLVGPWSGARRGRLARTLG